MAHVTELGAFRPAKDDRIFVDTNVWLYLTFSPMQKGTRRYKAQAYSAFVSDCRRVSASLLYSQAVLAEIVHSIERVMYDAYTARHGEIKKKVYREIADQRKSVVAEIEAVSAQIASLGTLESLLLDQYSVHRGFDLLRQSTLDGYDALHVEAMRQAQVSTILTDDRDFASVTNIIVVCSTS